MKDVVIRTENAPAPFRERRTPRRSRRTDFVFVSGQLGLEPGDTELDRRWNSGADRADARNLAAILEAAGSGIDQLVKTTVFLKDLDDFQGMNEVYARHVGERPPARSTVAGRGAPVRRSRRDRGDRDLEYMQRTLEDYVEGSGSTRTSSAAPSATSCSGSTRRTRTSSFPASTTRISAPRSSPTEVEDLEVAGQLVGVRLFRAIEVAASRRPGSSSRRRVASAHRPGPARLRDRRRRGASVEDDMGRRDFTVNAIARRLATGEIVDPFGGVADLENGVLRTVRRGASTRILSVSSGACASSPSLGSTRTERRSADAGGSGERALVSGERDPGWARLGRDRRALAAATRRATREGAAARPRHRRPRRASAEFAQAIGFVQSSERQHLRSTSTSSPSCRPRRMRGPRSPCGSRLFHDLGKPHADGKHAERSAELAAAAMRRLRYPTNLRTHVTRLVSAHAFPLDHVDELFARRILRAHGDELAFDLVAHRTRNSRQEGATSWSSTPPLGCMPSRRTRPTASSRRLAVDGSDLIALGYGERPELGAALDGLLDRSSTSPSLNTRDRLLDRARAQLP